MASILVLIAAFVIMCLVGLAATAVECFIAGEILGGLVATAVTLLVVVAIIGTVCDLIDAPLRRR